MSSDQADTFKKFRDADDPTGNLGWSSRMAKKAMQISPGAPQDVEQQFELRDDERLLWRLLKLPRRYLDLENAGVLPADRVRGILRGLVSADVVDIIEGEAARPIVPLEITRLKKQLNGETVGKPTGNRLRPRVFRPDIGIGAQGAAAYPPPPKAPAATPPASAPPPPPKAAPTGAGATLSAEESELKKRIEAAHALLREQNHFQFLGVPPTAGPAEVKQAYVNLAREFHPDVIAGTALGQDGALSKKLKALFTRLQDAHRVLASPEERRRYEDQLRVDPTAGRGRETGGKVRRPEEARVLAKKAEHLFKARDFVQAERHFKMALELDEQSREGQLGYAWCIYSDAGRPKEARIAEAKRLLSPLVDGGFAEAAWRLAMIARTEGDEAGHTRWVNKTVALNPKHPDAVREKRLADLRRQKTAEPPKPKGFLDKLRGR